MPRAVGIRLVMVSRWLLLLVRPATFTLGADMMEGESKTVTWSATNAEDKTKTGSATFNKIKEVVIPTPTGIFAYFLAPSDWNQVDCWAWNNDRQLYLVVTGQV